MYRNLVKKLYRPAPHLTHHTYGHVRRFQKTYRDLAKRHPSFRERSEVTELIVEVGAGYTESIAIDRR